MHTGPIPPEMDEAAEMDEDQVWDLGGWEGSRIMKQAQPS